MDKDYIYPTIQLLDNEKNTSLDKNDIIVNSKRLQKVLISFNVNAKVENVIVGPTITLYEIKLGNGVRVSKIKNLKEDLAYNIGRRVTNIQIIPPKGLVYIIYTKKILNWICKSGKNYRSNGGKRYYLYLYGK